VEASPDGQEFGIDAGLYAGLREIAAGLKQAVDDDGQVIVELFRNCVCGSTLMNCFRDRRDTSEAGLRRRTRFGELIATLVDQGLERERAHAELLKVLRGEPSTILKARPRNAGNASVSAKDRSG